MLRKLFFLLCLGILVGVVFAVIVRMYYSYGRTVIYPLKSGRTMYPGNEVVTIHRSERILVSPINPGRPFFDEAWMRFKYPTKDYEITEIASQDELQYYVGQVLGWEDIPNSQDKYLLLRSSVAGETVKWRIGFVGEDTTYLSVENTSLRLKNDLNPIDKYIQPSCEDVGYIRLSHVVHEGDTVVLIPRPDYPSYMKRDNSGNAFALWLILRRIGGVRNLEMEMTK